VKQKDLKTFEKKPVARAERIIRVRDGKTGKFIKFASEEEYFEGV